MIKKSKDGAALLSFKISVRADDLRKALDPTIWPLRVKVREYIYYPKKKKVDDDSNKDNQTKSSQPIPDIVVQPPTPQLTNMAIDVSHAPRNDETLTISNRFGPLADASTSNNN